MSEKQSEEQLKFIHTVYKLVDEYEFKDSDHSHHEEEFKEVFKNQLSILEDKVMLSITLNKLKTLNRNVRGVK